MTAPASPSDLAGPPGSAVFARLGPRPGPVEEGLDRKRRGAERHRPGTEPAQLDRGGGEGMAQRVLPGRLTDVGQQLPAEQQAGPAAEDDALRVEQVDQGAEPGAQVLRGLGEYRRREWRRARGVDQLGERELLVVGRHRSAVPFEYGLRAGVRLEA